TDILHQLLPLLLAGHIQGEEPGIVPQLGRLPFAALQIDIGQDDVEAIGVQPPGNGRSQTGGGSRYQGDLHDCSLCRARAAAWTPASRPSTIALPTARPPPP